MRFHIRFVYKPVLVFKDECNGLVAMLKREVWHAARKVHGKIWIAIEVIRQHRKVSLHAAEVRSNQSQSRMQLKNMITRR